MKAVVTGGGTGGHIMPAIAVAEALKALRPDAEIHYVGGIGGMEARLVPEAGLPFHGVTARKLRKVLSPGTVGVLFALLKGCREAGAFLREYQPDVLIGTGGYVAAATTIMATRLGIPALIQEQNAVAGRTNRLLAGRVGRVCISFPDEAGAFPAERTILTGVPIRSSVVGAATRATARERLHLRRDAFVLLVVGGSQGAQRLNQAVLEAAALLPASVQILHLAGSANAEAVARTAAGLGLGGDRYQAHAFFDRDQMALAYAACDAIFCRCGASTLAEATANGLPLIMTPLPTAYADHQTANALAVERAGGGVLLPQASLTAEQLAGEIGKLAADPLGRERVAAASKRFGKPDAAAVVAGAAIEMARRDRPSNR